jgi:hypothetical protein
VFASEGTALAAVVVALTIGDALATVAVVVAAVRTGGGLALPGLAGAVVFAQATARAIERNTSARTHDLIARTLPEVLSTNTVLNIVTFDM